MEPESRPPPWTRILSIPCEKETYHTRVIFFRPNVAIIFLRQRCHKLLALADPDLQHQHSAQPKPRPRLRNQFPQQLVPTRACEKRHFGIVQHFARKILPVFGRNVRKIRGDHIEVWFHTFKQVASQEPNTIDQAESLGIFAGEHESIFGNIGPDDLRFWKFRSQSECDDAATSS